MELVMMGISFPHPKGAFCPRMVEDYYTFCCFETPFVYEVEGALYPGQPGDILITPPGHVIYHGPRRDAERGFVNDWAHIRGDDLTALLNRYPIPLNLAFSLGQSFFLRRDMEELQAEYYSAESGREEVIQAILTRMVIRLHRAYQNLHSQRTGDSAIQSVHRLIAANPAERWTLERLAGLSGYSVSRFSELYRMKFGIAPVQDLLNCRLELAKQLLASGRASVGFVAESCGFQSVSYFSKFFSAAVGFAPTEYIRRMTAKEPQAMPTAPDVFN